jgi:hypothetical protein
MGISRKSNGFVIFIDFLEIHCSYWSYVQIIFLAKFASQGIRKRILQWLHEARTLPRYPLGLPKNSPPLAKDEFNELGI